MAAPLMVLPPLLLLKVYQLLIHTAEVVTETLFLFKKKQIRETI